MPPVLTYYDEVAVLTKKDFNGILAEIERNNDLLQSCHGPHDFQRVKAALFTDKHQCQWCGGIADSSAVFWYTEGLKHADRARSQASE